MLAQEVIPIVRFTALRKGGREQKPQRARAFQCNLFFIAIAGQQALIPQHYCRLDIRKPLRESLKRLSVSQSA
jgi:hypothetical protein